MAVDTKISFHGIRNNLLFVYQKRHSANADSERTIDAIGGDNLFVWVSKNREVQPVLITEPLMACSTLRADTHQVYT
jgi:hypothetical protein